MLGPLVGTTILVAAAGVFRPLAEYRQAVYGLLLVAMAFLPFGVYRHDRHAAAPSPAGPRRHGVAEVGP